MHGPRDGRGWAGAGGGREEGCSLWRRVFWFGFFFFFFPRKKFALATPQGCRLLLPPPPPLCAHLLVQIAKRLPLRELQILQEPGSPTLWKERLESPSALRCKELAVGFDPPLTQTAWSLGTL